MKFEQLINEHPCFFGDLKIASQLLEKKRPIVAAALAEYVEALKEYDTDNDAFAERTRRRTFDWEVSPSGDMYCADASYHIAAERLGTENWLDHIAGKTWVNLNTFIPVYIEACRRAGIKTVKIQY